MLFVNVLNADITNDMKNTNNHLMFDLSMTNLMNNHDDVHTDSFLIASFDACRNRGSIF